MLSQNDTTTRFQFNVYSAVLAQYMVAIALRPCSSTRLLRRRTNKGDSAVITEISGDLKHERNTSNPSNLTG